MNSELLRAEAIRQGRDYDRKMVEEYDELFGSDHWDFIRRERARWMVNHLRRLWTEGNRRKRVLEVGCGIGFTTIEVAKLLAKDLENMTAIDMSFEALRIAEKLISVEEASLSRRISFKVENFFDHSGGPYDVVYMHEVFEHIPDPAAIFEKARQLLVPGGFFMVSTPNYDRFANRLAETLGRSKVMLDPFHIKEYNIKDMRGLGKEWQEVEITGRQLLDEGSTKALMGCGVGFLKKITAPIAIALARNKLAYRAGKLAPRISSDLLCLYRKSGK